MGGLSLASAYAHQNILHTTCNAASIHLPAIHGIEVQKVEANLITGYSAPTIDVFFEHQPHEASFCNVTVTYNHPRHDLAIGVETWLPAHDSWNGRLLGVGGGGFVFGRFAYSYGAMMYGLSEGFAAVSTDAGHNESTPYLGDFLLNKDGEVDLYQMATFSYTSLDDAARISKQVISSYYGHTPRHSYFTGCSQGGRQGMSLAQRYPDAYDGVLSLAPAINLPSFLMWMNWPQQLMNELREYPHTCEFEALRKAAIATCDLDDGVPDGVISDPDRCSFDPFEMTGTEIECGDAGRVKISGAAAQILYQTWQGVTTMRGSNLWPGCAPDADIAPLVSTECSADGVCHGIPFPLCSQWITAVLKEDLTFNLSTLTREAFIKLVSYSEARYNTILATDHTNLSGLREHNGKLLLLHGTADQLIPLYGSRSYYEAVVKRNKHGDTAEFFRYFEAPGLAHCAGGAGPYPRTAFKSLVDWVEHGKAPNEIEASWDDGGSRPLCQYPLVARYTGTGDWKEYKNYYCAESHLSTRPLSMLLQQAKQLLSSVLRI